MRHLVTDRLAQTRGFALAAGVSCCGAVVLSLGSELALTPAYAQTAEAQSQDTQSQDTQPQGTQPQDTQPVPATLDTLPLDAGALLRDTHVTSPQLNDPVWQLEPRAGYILLAVPHQLTEVDQATVVGDPPIMLRGGRFIAWQIGEQATDTQDGFSEGSGQRDRNLAHPMLARRFTVQPDQSVTWELERNLSPATVQEQGGRGNGNLYALLLNPDALRDAQPERPGADDRNRNRDRSERPTPDQLAQQREAENQYRNALREYQELRNAVRELPTTFTQGRTPTVWALYELNPSARTLQFDGPDPYPWAIDMSVFETLRAGAGGNRRANATPDAFANAMQGLAQDDHPVSQGMLAVLIAESNQFRQMTVGDPTFNAAQILLADGATPANQPLVDRLVEQRPLTEAAAQLLTPVLADLDPATQRAVLSDMLQPARGTPDPNAPTPTQRINTMLADTSDDALAVDSILSVAADIAANTRGSSRNTTDAYAGPDLTAVQGDRRDQAVRFVVQHAAESEALGDWLDRGLLGSTDDALSLLTLEYLVLSVEEGPQPMADDQASVQGSNPSPGVAMDMDRFDGPTRPGSSGRGTDDGETLWLIPLASTDHRLFVHLASPDAQRRDLAWQALGRFTLVEPDRRQSNRGQPNQGEEGPMQALVQAAQSLPNLPQGFPQFVANQSPSPQAAADLITLLLTVPSPEDRPAVAGVMVGSGQPLGEVLTQIEPIDRVRLANAIYAAETGNEPPVALLLINDQVAQWFGNQVAVGQLPTRGAFLDGLGGQRGVVDYLVSLDRSDAQGRSQVTAIADAFAGSVGYDTSMTPEITAILNEALDDIGDNAARGTTQLSTVLDEQRTRLMLQRLAQSSGPYTVVLQITQTSPAHSPATSDLPEPGPYELGNLNLSVQGDTVTTDPDAVRLRINDQGGLMLAAIADLSTYDNDTLDSLPIPSLRISVPLTPTDTGGWVGHLPLQSADHTARILFEPAD